MTHLRSSQSGTTFGKLLRWLIVIVVCAICLSFLGMAWYADRMNDSGSGANARQSSTALPAPPQPDGSGGSLIAWDTRSGHKAPALSLKLRATDADYWWSKLSAPSIASAKQPDTKPSDAVLQLAWPNADGELARAALCSGEGAPFSGCRIFVTRMVVNRDATDERSLAAFSEQTFQDGRPMPGFWTQSRGSSAGTKLPEFAGFSCPGSSGGFWQTRAVNTSKAEAALAAQLHCFAPDSWLHRAVPFLFGYERHVFAPKCDNTGQVCRVTFLYRNRLVTVDPPAKLGDSPLQRFDLMAAAWKQLVRMEREAASPATAQELLAEARVQLQSCQALEAEMQRAARKSPQKVSITQPSATQVLRASCLRAAELGTRAAAASPREALVLIAAATDALWQVEHGVDRIQQRYYELLLATPGSVSDASTMRTMARLLQSLPTASPGVQDDPSGNARRERLIAKARPWGLNPPAGSNQAAHELRQALLRHLPEDSLSEDRISILRALLDETLSQAAANLQSEPNEVVDAWSAYISALWHSQRWAELHTAARSLQTAWLLTPEPVGAIPHTDGAREFFVSSQLVAVYLDAVRAGMGEADTVSLAEAATTRAERVFGPGSSAATDVRQMRQQLGRLQPTAKPALRMVQKR